MLSVSLVLLVALAAFQDGRYACAHPHPVRRGLSSRRNYNDASISLGTIKGSDIITLPVISLIGPDVYVQIPNHCAHRGSKLLGTEVIVTNKDGGPPPNLVADNKDKATSNLVIECSYLEPWRCPEGLSMATYQYCGYHINNKQSSTTDKPWDKLLSSGQDGAIRESATTPEPRTEATTTEATTTTEVPTSSPSGPICLPVTVSFLRPSSSTDSPSPLLYLKDKSEELLKTASNPSSKGAKRIKIITTSPFSTLRSATEASHESAINSEPEATDHSHSSSRSVSSSAEDEASKSSSSELRVITITPSASIDSDESDNMT